MVEDNEIKWVVAHTHTHNGKSNYVSVTNRQPAKNLTLSSKENLELEWIREKDLKANTTSPLKKSAGFLEYLNRAKGDSQRQLQSKDSPCHYKNFALSRSSDD